MRIKLFVVLLLVFTLFAFSQTAQAVQFGQPDGNGHPYVGLVVFYTSNMTPLWRCSGALISNTVFLTAGHCTGIDVDLGFAPSKAQVWFAPGPIPRDSKYTGGSCNVGGPYTGYPCAGGVKGTPHAHPDWNGRLTIPATHDVGVVVLDTPVTDKGMAKLAPLNYLDTFLTRRGLQDTQLTVVGYGLQSVKPVEMGLRERYIGTTSIVNLRSALNDGNNIQQTSDPGLGNGPGGTCFGDSGGPVFSTNAQNELVIVAVNSFVLNLNCRGAGFGHRVDIPDSRDFLKTYVALP
jgi:hypothetical protein